jgi:hypothetical protein
MSEMINMIAASVMASRNGVAFSPTEDFRVIVRAIVEAMRELPEEPGPRYTAGEYSRRTQEAMVDDALRQAS